MPHNDRVKAAASNNSGLGKWKVTPHLDQNMDKPWGSHDTGVAKAGRKEFRHGRVKTRVGPGHYSMRCTICQMITGRPSRQKEIRPGLGPWQMAADGDAGRDERASDCNGST